jgi:hypothetical protein
LETDEKASDVLEVGVFSNMDFRFDIIRGIFVQKSLFDWSLTDILNPYNLF